MKKILILLIVSVITAFSAEPLAGYLKDGKWHFIDYEGNEMFTPPEFTDIAGYRNGYFLITMDINDKTQWVYMDTTGKVVIKTDADKARLFRENRAILIYFLDSEGYDRKYGIIDLEGNFIVEPYYLDAIDFSEEKTYIMNKIERGFIDKKGDWIFKLDSLVGYPYSEGYAPVSTKDYLFGYIDETGEMAIDPQYDEAKAFSEGLAAVNTAGKFGFIDKEGNWVIHPSFTFAQKFQDGYCFVGKATPQYEPIWGIINKSGFLTVNFMYDEAKGFNMGIATVKKNDKYYFIDPLGNKIINREFDYAEEFKEGLAWASEYEKGKSGFINPTGEYIIEIPECDVVIDFRLNRRLYFK